MFEQTQFDLLRAWIMRATELPDVILAHPGAPRPTTDYGMLNLLRADRINRPVDVIFEDNPDHTGAGDTVNLPAFELVVQEYEFTWSFQVYANDPITVANRIIPWFHSQTGREFLGELNMFGIGPVLRVPDHINNNWQDRATVDLRVRAYVCTGTTTYGTGQVLLGRVPVDLAETIDVFMDADIFDETLTATKP